MTLTVQKTPVNTKGQTYNHMCRHAYKHSLYWLCVCIKADFDVNEFVVASQTSPQSGRTHLQVFLYNSYHSFCTLSCCNCSVKSDINFYIGFTWLWGVLRIFSKQVFKPFPFFTWWCCSSDELQNKQHYCPSMKLIPKQQFLSLVLPFVSSEQLNFWWTNRLNKGKRLHVSNFNDCLFHQACQ